MWAIDSSNNQEHKIIAFLFLKKWFDHKYGFVKSYNRINWHVSLKNQEHGISGEQIKHITNFLENYPAKKENKVAST